MVYQNPKEQLKAMEQWNKQKSHERIKTNAILDHILHKVIEEHCCCNANLPNFEPYRECDVHDIIDSIRIKYKKAMSNNFDVEEYYKDNNESTLDRY